MILPSRAAAGLLVAVWLACLAPAAAQEKLGDSRDEIRQTLLTALNEARAKQGLPPVRLSAALSKAAQAQVDDMAARRYYVPAAAGWSHPPPRILAKWLQIKEFYGNLSRPDCLCRTVDRAEGAWGP
jgi:hypothetical protein